jgi:hypothetical protein
MTDELPEHTASPELEKLFQKLLHIKEDVFVAANASCPSEKMTLMNIFNRLDEIIREKK